MAFDSTIKEGYDKRMECKLNEKVKIDGQDITLKTGLQAYHPGEAIDGFALLGLSGIGKSTAINTLLDQYPNLLITRTFSQSRSLAGARVGFGIGSEELIEDLNRIRNSQNPYNVSSLDEKAAIAAINDNDYYVKNVQKIIDERERTISRLRELGFYCTDSKTNFIFAKNDAVSGEELYKGLKERGVLVRHFSKQRIDDYIRVTVGNSEQMDIFIEKTKEILKENEDR